MSEREPWCGWRLVSSTVLLGRLSAGPGTRCTPRTVTFGRCFWILVSSQNVPSDNSCRVSGTLGFSFRYLPALSRSRAGRAGRCAGAYDNTRVGAGMTLRRATQKRKQEVPGKEKLGNLEARG